MTTTQEAPSTRCTTLLRERSNAHSVQKYKKMAALTLFWNQKASVASLASLFPDFDKSIPILFRWFTEMTFV